MQTRKINEDSMKLKSVLSVAVALVVASMFIACRNDSYEKGEGEYSLMRADFAELTIDSQKQVSAFITDDGDAYTLTTPYTAQWIETADTTYRAIIYYNKVEGGRAEPVAVGTVPTLAPTEHWRFNELPQDPIGFESIWMARSCKYLNVGLLVKTGRVDDDEVPHLIGLAQDTVLVHADQRRTAYYRLLHSQNDAPEYYTNRRYVSILLPQDRPDTIRLSINTFDGVIEKTIEI